METNEKFNPGYGKRVVILTVLTLLSGLFSSLLFQLGIFLIPCTAALLALVLLAENKNKRRVSYILPIVLCVVEFIINGIYSLNCLCSAIVAFILYFGFLGKRSKGECSVYSTIVITAFVILSFVLSAFLVTESFSIDTVKEFYIAELEAIKEEFVSAMSSFSMGTTGDGQQLFEVAELSELFDSSVNLLISYLTILGFALTGIAFKIFCSVAGRVSDCQKAIAAWKFSTPPLFVYFFYALVIFSLFISDSSSLLGMSVMNLYMIFMFVYAYLGYKYLSELLTKSVGKPAVAKLIVFCAIFLFSAFAVQLISYIGAFMSILNSRKNQENLD